MDSSSKFALAMACVMGLTLVHVCRAQNDPQDFLDAHNKVRATQEGVDPLVWDDEVARFAQNYANQRIPDCKPQHSDFTTHSYGENIFIAPESLATAAQAVEHWYAEKENYDYENNKCLKGVCGHYTQLMWSDSLRLGCAAVKCDTGNYFITCNYDPAGNYVGEVPY